MLSVPRTNSRMQMAHGRWPNMLDLGVKRWRTGLPTACRDGTLHIAPWSGPGGAPG